jgi:hypothetical protein
MPKSKKTEKGNVDDTESKEQEKNDATTNEQKSETAPRKRGRPRIEKPPTSSAQQKKFIDSDQEEEKDPILLHIPYTDEDSTSEISEKNQFTMKDESDEEDIRKDKNLIVYLTDDDSDDEDNIKSLKKKIKEKDKIIKRLKLEMTSRSDNGYNVNYSVPKKKDQNTNIHQVKMVNINKDNKVNVGEKIKYACWWCSCNFDNPPCFIPEKYSDSKYYVFGCFDSYNCALAYILKDDEYKIANRVSLVKRLYSELYNNNKPLYPSPPKELLSKFGGPMSIEEYRNAQNITECKDYKLRFAKIIQNPVFFEETKKEGGELTKR